MVSKNEASRDSRFGGFGFSSRFRKSYTEEEIIQILESSSLESQQKLSRDFFYRDNFYKRILIYYATLLKYIGILIPNPAFGKDLSTSFIQKKYYAAVDYIENLSLPEMLTRFSISALVDGCYYGIIQSIDKKDLVILDLPVNYCRSWYKDLRGNDIIEFNVNYFNSILDEEERNEILKLYPKVVSSHFKKLSKGKVKSAWVVIPSDIGVCFPIFGGRPPLINIIPASIRYDEAVETERERELDEIRKILVQKIPHLNDGTLLFEPDEAEVMHAGAVDMMKGNKNFSVLTSYGEVDAITSRTSEAAAANNLEKMVQNIYSTAGASSQLFAPTSSQSLEKSIENDVAFVMTLAHQYERFITGLVNSLFSNSNIDFKYMILPITYYNQSEIISDSFKLAQSGFSFLMPALAMGISQRDIVNLKNLENNVLELHEKLIPLSSAYTHSADNEDGGRPKLAEEEKSEKTVKNEDSIDNQGGSN